MLIGFVLLLLSIWLGGRVAADPTWAPSSPSTALLAWMLIAYGFIAAVLPVWLALAPRDYLSTFLKIGTILLLAVAIFFAAPQLQMPAVTGSSTAPGPVWSGSLFPLPLHHHVRGAVSGFHALISPAPRRRCWPTRAPAPDRLRRHADGGRRGDHGPDRRRRAAAGRVLRHEQPGWRHRHHRGQRRQAISQWASR